uniref:tRNA:m(4)X modification enzyme TRM13 n=1 Tax=Kryptolebias marmoratus TaxID=37003 RepID=A0A3Q2ZT32_KRYMA
MIVGKGKRFCGEHATMVSSRTRGQSTVTEDKLEKHLKKCNSRDRPRVYFVENINAGPADGDEKLPQDSSLSWDMEDKILSHFVLNDELTNPKNGDSAHKHLKQQVRSVKFYI